MQIIYAIPGFILLILLEWLYGLARGRNTYAPQIPVPFGTLSRAK